MRNAKESDMLSARNGVVPFGVVFSSSHGLVHRKPLQNTEGLRNDKLVLMEHVTKNLVYIFHPDNLYDVPRGTAQQPRKPRRKPIKGTRPEKLIPMSADVKLKVGDKVVLADGKREKVVQPVCCHGYWYNMVNGWYDTEHKITHKIVPWHEQHHLYFDGKLVAITDGLKFTVQEKSPEQEAFENGYWVPFVAGAQTSCPPFAVGYKIDYLMQETMAYKGGYAENLRWTQRNNGADIVAFRKAEQ